MATEFQVAWGEEANLPNEYVPGRLLVTTDTKTIQLDTSEATRILLGQNLNLQNGAGDNSLEQTPAPDATDWIPAKGQTIPRDAQQTAEGNPLVGAFGDYSVMLGSKSQATGKRALAEGTSTIALGNYSHAEGNKTIVTGVNSHAEGLLTQATGSNSHAEGDTTKASGASSHAGGQYSAATAHAAFAHGVGVVASQQAQAVFGKYNNEDQDAAFIIGNGNKDEATDIVTPSNLFVVKNNGDIISNGVLLVTVKNLFEKWPYVTLEKERRVMNTEEIKNNKGAKELIFSILKVHCHNLNPEHNYKLHLLTLARSKKENNGWYHPNNEGLVNDPDLKNREDKVAYDQLPPLGYINLVKHSHGSNIDLKYPERDEDPEIPSYCITEWAVDKETGIVEIPLNEFIVPLLKPSYNKSENEWDWNDCKLIGVKASYRAPLLFRFVLIDTTTEQRYDTHSDFSILRLGINRNRIGKNLDNAGVSIQQAYKFQDKKQNTVTVTDYYVDNRNLYISII